MRFELQRNDRKGFLAQVAKTAAVGFGIALYPSLAKASRSNSSTDEIVRCCALTGNCNPCNPVTDAALWCASLSCCVCESGGLDEQGCKNYGFAPC
jgi:hypothetical protein